MACGSCGSSKGVVKYKWTSPTGETVVYDEEVQAKAAKIKNGGSYKEIRVR